MYKDILFAVDLEDENSWKKALPTALEYAKAFGSNLHMVTVVPAMGPGIVGAYFPEGYEEKMMERALEHLHAFTKEHVPGDIHVQHIVAHGSIYQEILRVSEEVACDLIVMAAHRPELSDYLLGPNAARVVRHSEKSVLIVRG